MFNILFWNLKRNSIENFIIDCITERNIDIAVFSEFDSIDFFKIENALGKMYSRIITVQNNKKVTLIAKTTFMVTHIQSQSRYSIYSIETAVKNYLLAAVHLEDRRNYQISDRTNTIQHLIADIEQTERLFKCNNTIVIGDFNANPYDEELLSKYAFNAVLFKTIIDKSEFTNPTTLKQKRFYNPILHYISEDTKMYGSFYYEQNTGTPYWHCLDQVLIRKNLINFLKHVEYLKTINGRDLLINMIPNKKISDHLPLLVNLREVANEI